MSNSRSVGIKILPAVVLSLGILTVNSVAFAEENTSTTEAETIVHTTTLTNEEINLRDPYILTQNGEYYMYGTRAENCFSEPMDGFDCYVSTDLENWKGPYEIYHKTEDNPADWAYYAPECYEIDGKYYFFCSWREENGDEYENILIADNPLGPFTLYAENLTWGIDATLYQEDGKYYLINSYNMHSDATGPRGIYAAQLSDDFKSIIGEEKLLFTTEGADWISEYSFDGETANTMTDGPCPYRLSDGTLLILWSSMDSSGFYNVGVAKSDNGKLNGNWTHDKEPIFPGNQGHNMIFTALDGTLMTAMHYPNDLGNEHPYFLELNEDLENKTLSIVEQETVSVYKSEEIDIRDAYVLTCDGKYYLYGTTGFEAFNGSQSGFRVFESNDLENWTGPYTVFPNDGTSWATQRYWAPEVYQIDETFYMFAGWSHSSVEQRLCVLTADNPLGPFTILNADLAPGNDPTLYEENGKNYLIYNNPEGYGTENHDKRMMILELTDNLSHAVGAPIPIFDHTAEGLDLGGELEGMPEGWETFITPTGRTILMWSFQYEGWYCSSLAYFDDGILGDYTFSNELFTPLNMGHNNFFYSLDGDLMMCSHYPNDYDCELGCSYPVFFKVNYDEKNDTLILDTTEFIEKYGEEYSKKFPDFQLDNAA